VPGVTAAGSVCDVPVTSTDFYPTLLELLGLALPNDEPRDGVSFAGLLGGGPAPAREALRHVVASWRGVARRRLEAD